MRFFERACKLKNKQGCLFGATIYYRNRKLGIPYKERYKKAFPLYKLSCQLGSGKGCWGLGWFYEAGFGTPKNQRLAFTSYKRACQLNNSHGCRALAEFYAQGMKPASKNQKKAFFLFQKSCHAKDFATDACYSLAWYYRWGEKGVPKNPQKALVYSQKACHAKHSHPFGCELLAELYYYGVGVKQNYKKARQYYKKACQDGKGSACSSLGFIFFGGKGVKQNYKKAFLAFKKSCENDDPHGCYTLASYYIQGMGTPKNSIKAMDALKLSHIIFSDTCNMMKDASACLNAGLNYFYGRGIIRNLQKAFQLFARSCRLNSGKGCHMLAWSYYKGKGITPNPQKAFKAARRSCQLNSGEGCALLAELHDYGVGTQKDAHKALIFAQKACDARNYYGCAKAVIMLYERPRLKNKKRGFLLLKKNCQLNHAWSCRVMGRKYLSGQGTEKSKAKAKKAFEKACKLGLKYACKELKDFQ